MNFTNRTQLLHISSVPLGSLTIAAPFSCPAEDGWMSAFVPQLIKAKDKELAGRYIENWRAHARHSEVYNGKTR